MATRRTRSKPPRGHWEETKHSIFMCVCVWFTCTWRARQNLWSVSNISQYTTRYILPSLWRNILRHSMCDFHSTCGNPARIDFPRTSFLVTGTMVKIHIFLAVSHNRNDRTVSPCMKYSERFLSAMLNSVRGREMRLERKHMWACVCLREME